MIIIIIMFSLCLNMAVTNCCGISVRKQIVKLRLAEPSDLVISDKEEKCCLITDVPEERKA